MPLTAGNTYGASSDYVIGGASLAMFYVAPTVGSANLGALLLQFDLTEESNMEFNDDGGININLTQLRADPWAHKFLDTYKPTGPDATEQIKLENNLALIGAGANVEKPLVVVNIGGVAKKTGKRRLVAAYGGLSIGSGTTTYSADTANRPSVEFVSAPAPAAINIRNADLVSTNLTTQTDYQGTPKKENNIAGTADSGMECLAEAYITVPAGTIFTIATNGKYAETFVAKA